MQLQYDPETQQWSYVNVAQTFIDTATFSSTDPQFQYGSNNQQDDNQEDDADAGGRLFALVIIISPFPVALIEVVQLQPV